MWKTIQQNWRWKCRKCSEPKTDAQMQYNVQLVIVSLRTLKAYLYTSEQNTRFNIIVFAPPNWGRRAAKGNYTVAKQLQLYKSTNFIYWKFKIKSKLMHVLFPFTWWLCNCNFNQCTYTCLLHYFYEHSLLLIAIHALRRDVSAALVHNCCWLRRLQLS